NASDAGIIKECLQLSEASRLAVNRDAIERLADGPKPSSTTPQLPRPALRINDFFEKVFVINLDRRPDRWQRVARRLERAGISAERVTAVDGTAPDVAAEYQAYAETALSETSSAIRAIKSSKEFFQDYDSEAARVAFIETKDGKKAVQS